MENLLNKTFEVLKVNVALCVTSRSEIFLPFLVRSVPTYSLQVLGVFVAPDHTQ